MVRIASLVSFTREGVSAKWALDKSLPICVHILRRAKRMLSKTLAISQKCVRRRVDGVGRALSQFKNEQHMGMWARAAQHARKERVASCATLSHLVGLFVSNALSGVPHTFFQMYSSWSNKGYRLHSVREGDWCDSMKEVMSWGKEVVQYRSVGNL